MEEHLREDDFEERMIELMADYAVKKPKEGSRDFEEPDLNKKTRSEFQRDRDRIIHSKAFRRLMYKTQVFVNHENDHYRTRLTHSLEVAQMSRGIARSLCLNEDLAEAIALGHDLGHTPYGHAVESYLSEQMKDVGGFYHNEQSVRVVELLEDKKGLERGLNLTWEVREGILKHTGDTNNVCKHLEQYPLPSLEGQVVRIADSIAYVTHDLEDGIESGIFDEMIRCGIVKKDFLDQVWATFDADKSWGISRLINALIVDLVEGTKENIKALGISCPDNARKQKNLVVKFKRFEKEFKWLKDFVGKHVYSSPLASIMDAKAERIVMSLFKSYSKNPKQLPYNILHKYENPEKIELKNSYPATDKRVLCDFIAGLTDRYAIVLYNKLYNESERIISAK